MLCFAVTLNFRLSIIVFGSSFVVYFLVVPLIEKRAAATARSGASGDQR
jgi:hypothetical protein